jgi:hypothetical protein
MLLQLHIGLHATHLLFLSDLTESQQAFEKSSNIKFHENWSSESRVVSCGRTDGHDEANNHFSKPYERA